MNQLMLKGRLVRDAEVRSVGGNSSVCEFTIAFNESYVNSAGEKVETVHYFDCQRWGMSEKLQSYLVKGKEVLVQGSLKQNRWVNKDGKNFSRVLISVQKIELLGNKVPASTSISVAEEAIVVHPSKSSRKKKAVGTDQSLDFPE